MAKQKRLNEDQKEFIRLLSVVRKRGDTVERIARELDKPYATIARWCRGDATPYADTAKRLLKKLQLFANQGE